MTAFEIIIISGLLALPFIVVVWAYKKRRRLFYNVHFTAQTVWMQYQTQSKHRAMELVDYQQQEAEENEPGKMKDDDEISLIV